MYLKKPWLIIIMAVFLMGWSIGYLSLPYLPSRDQYWLGALSVLAAFILFLLLNKKLLSKQRNGIIFLTILALLISGSLYVFNSLIEKDIAANSKAEQLMKESLRQEVKMIYAQERIYQKRKVDKALQAVDLNSSTDSAFKQIDYLSGQLKAEKRLFKDSIILASPGKGYLLLELLNSDLDSSTLQQLIANINFSYADLEGADMSHKQLNGIHLSSALLYQIDLTASKLYNANLDESIMTEGRLDSVILKHAKLANTDLSWSSINHADLTSVVAMGITLSNSSVQDTRLDSAKLAWSTNENTLFRNSSLKVSDFMSSKLNYADFTDSDLQEARLSRVQLDKSIFNNTVLGNNAVSEDWFKRLKKENVEGRKQMAEEYQVKEDSSFLFPYETHFLKLK